MQKKQVPKIAQTTQNESLKLKPNPMTYNPHQTALSREIPQEL